MTSTFIDCELTWQPAPGGAVRVMAWLPDGASALVKSAEPSRPVYAMASDERVGTLVESLGDRLVLSITDPATVAVVRGGVYKIARVRVDDAGRCRVSLHDTSVEREFALKGRDPALVSSLAARARGGSPEAFYQLIQTAGIDRANRELHRR